MVLNMISGLNHVTLSVSELERSFRFYVDVLGFKPVAKWVRGAYLVAGDLWFCLSLDDMCRNGPLAEYSHIAFSVPEQDFASATERLMSAKVDVWKENKSEGKSLYVLDPDGHKLEIHVGDLASRIASLKNCPYEGLELFVF